MANHLRDINAAAKRIQPHIMRTPVMTSSTMDKLVGRQCYFKCESFQKTGSFKVRGALNTVLQLKEKDFETSGVITHSSGNHAQALAYASKIANLPCTVVVPSTTPHIKCDAIRGYGADLVFCEPSVQSREETCERLSKERNQQYISSHNHPDVIIGQGTIAMEFLEEVPDLDAIFVSICGGGLSSGCCLYVKAVKPSCKVFIVEPKGKELQERLISGERSWPVPPRYLDTIAEGCRLQWVGDNTFPILYDMAEKEVFPIDDKQIVDAMKFVWSRMKLIVETSAAISVAALFTEQFKKLDPSIKKVGVVLCGGNVDVDNLPW